MDCGADCTVRRVCGIADYCVGGTVNDDYEPLTTWEKIGAVALWISSVVVMTYLFVQMKTLTDWILK